MTNIFENLTLTISSNDLTERQYFYLKRLQTACSEAVFEPSTIKTLVTNFNNCKRELKFSSQKILSAIDPRAAYTILCSLKMYDNLYFYYGDETIPMLEKWKYKFYRESWKEWKTSALYTCIQMQKHKSLAKYAKEYGKQRELEAAEALAAYACSR